MDYFKFVQQPSSYLCDFEFGILGDGPLSEQNSSNRGLSIGGIYFTIASIDVQHYNSWVAPHFTQPNGLTLRSHWGSRLGSFPSFFWSKFYETHGLGLIESHSGLLNSTAVRMQLWTFLIDNLITLMIHSLLMLYSFDLYFSSLFLKNPGGSIWCAAQKSDKSEISCVLGHYSPPPSDCNSCVIFNWFR